MLVVARRWLVALRDTWRYERGRWREWCDEFDRIREANKRANRR